MCGADIATEDTAIRWMLTEGWVWARHWACHYDWSAMELWCHGRCVARVPAPTFDRSLALAYGPAATAIGQNLKFPGVPKSRHWPGAENGARKPRAGRHHV